MVTPHIFQISALPIVGRTEGTNSSDFRRALVACFSMSPIQCVHVWDEIEDGLPSAVMISHLLWVLLFLKVYETENTMVVMVWTTQRTNSKWVRIVIEEIYLLTYVSGHVCFSFDCCIVLTIPLF